MFGLIAPFNIMKDLSVLFLKSELEEAISVLGEIAVVVEEEEEDVDLVWYPKEEDEDEK